MATYAYGRTAVRPYRYTAPCTAYSCTRTRVSPGARGAGGGARRGPGEEGRAVEQEGEEEPEGVTATAIRGVIITAMQRGGGTAPCRRWQARAAAQLVGLQALGAFLLALAAGDAGTCPANTESANYNGADHRQATAKDISSCCEMCATLGSSCTFWVFDTNEKLCHMKSVKGERIVAIGQLHFTSGTVSSDYKAPSKQAADARAVVHAAAWGSVATISSAEETPGYPFSNIISFADGEEAASTGVPYFLVSALDDSIKDALADPRMSLSLTAAQLKNGSTSPDCGVKHGGDPESPP
eukprot:SAG22_NODE_3274_length_1812_cov_1.203736_2_plen_296_part_01